MDRMKIIWVKSASELPEPEKGVNAQIMVSTKTIYAVEGKVTQAQLLHEEYHILAGHSANPITPDEFVDDEIKAHLYAYRFLKQPVRIIKNLRGMFVSLLDRYNTTPAVAIIVIRKVMQSNNIPKSWQKDFIELENEYKEMYK